MGLLDFHPWDWHVEAVFLVAVVFLAVVVAVSVSVGAVGTESWAVVWCLAA